MRIIYAGSPDIAVPALEYLAERWDVAAVLTSPDKPKGRSRKPEPCPVGAAAERLGLTVLKPEKLDREFRETVKALGADLLVVFAYGRIFSPVFLDLFPQGGINLHPSLLPLYRGPSPLPAAIAAGDTETGISIQELAQAMDSGDILLQEVIALEGDETTASLSQYVADCSGELFDRVLVALEDGAADPRPQDHEAATYCKLLSKEEGRIDWTLSASEIDCRVRAFTPWPGTFTRWKGQTLKVKAARPAEGQANTDFEAGTVTGVDKNQGILVQTGEGLLALRELQLPSKKAVDFKSFLNGNKDFPGSCLGENNE